MFVVIGTSPFMDTSVAVGPFKAEHRAHGADEHLTSLGWNTEVCELVSADEVGPVTNKEGL